jgi:predicted neuraminidase
VQHSRSRCRGQMVDSSSHERGQSRNSYVFGVVMNSFAALARRRMRPVFHSLAMTLAVLLPLGAKGREGGSPSEPLDHPGFIKSEFIFKSAPFPQCHASTLAESRGTLVAAWFGGSLEGKPDVGIWLAHAENSRWSEPLEVANGNSPDGKRYPCWNPVLFQAKDGPLLLFYKVGPLWDSWWGMLIRSTDGGRTWSEPKRLPDGILGPIKNKPVMLADGRLLCGSSTEDAGWRVHLEWTKDFGQSWEKGTPLKTGSNVEAIQPTILKPKDGSLQILCRTKQGRIAESRSSDGGRIWTELTLTQLPNPNSGIDAITLQDGRRLLVYNHTTGGRSPLNVAVSQDGSCWQAALVLEHDPHEYSYPAVIQTEDGLVHVTYTWRRQIIKHVTIDPRRLVLRDVANEK